MIYTNIGIVVAVIYLIFCFVSIFFYKFREYLYFKLDESIISSAVDIVDVIEYHREVKDDLSKALIIASALVLYFFYKQRNSSNFNIVVATIYTNSNNFFNN